MKRVLILSMIMAGGVTSAWAQNPNVLQQQAPNMPPPQQMPAEKLEPHDPSTTGSTGSTGNTGTLSDKLNASDGVIRPPDVGASGRTVKPPVPDPGTMPVIPPPGSPGGNQQVEPK